MSVRDLSEDLLYPVSPRSRTSRELSISLLKQLWVLVLCGEARGALMEVEKVRV